MSLEQLEAWWDEWKEGNRNKARRDAELYVDENRDLLEARYGHLTQEECVKMVGVFKQSNDQERILEIKCWVMSEYPPQHIGGNGTVELRRGQHAKRV